MTDYDDDHEIDVTPVPLDDMDHDRCGGETKDGSECTRPAGWGTDSNTGPCKDHVSDEPHLRRFNEESKNRILGAANEGALKKHCAMVAGITPQTLRNWLMWGETDLENGLETELSDFYLRFQRARGSGAVKRLQNASDEFILQSSYGYSKSQQIEHSGSIDTDPETVYLEMLEQAAEAEEDDTR